MKRFLLSVVLATSLAFTSCQFDDSDIWDTLNEYGESIRDHEQRISALEELCKQMNTNIEALQILVDALEKRDYVTNVSEVRSNGEVIGYTISFAYSDTVTIYHGKDGKDGQNGANGKDGYTPQIGVMKDTDGIYYWTLDGEWLLDGKGNKIQANGVNGTNGTNGSNGTNGTNGVTPQLKIENDYWYVSYDNGATWEKLGKATGDDGIDGENGEDGDSIFKSVTQDGECVYFNLADGTMITLPKHDKENIQFEDLQVKMICCQNWDTNNDGELSYAEAAAVTDIGSVFSQNDKIIAFSEFKYFEGVTSLSNQAFYNCANLWKIDLPPYITQFEEGTVSGGSSNGFRGYGCFLGTSIANIVLPNALKSIGNGAFAYCRELKSVIIPNGVTSIGSYAFHYCNSLIGMTIPDSITSIGKKAFHYAGKGGELFINCNIPDYLDYSYSAFYGADFAKITIGDSVTSIGEYAFYSCDSLTHVTIGKSVTSIGILAFWECSWLTSIYCKPITPPAIYYYNDYVYGSFPFNSVMKIYVPRNTYNSYMQYSSYDNNKVAQTNWYKYESYIQPYDFE